MIQWLSRPGEPPDAADGGERGLRLFLLLAFGISWIAWLPLLLGGWNTPVLIVGAFGPFAAALIVTGREEGKPGLVRWFRQVFRLRIGLLWWLGAAFFFPIAVGAIQYAIYMLLGGEPELSNLEYPWLAYPIALLLTTLFTGGNEEPGWRGFALPRLLERYSPLIASLILGVIWVGWHLPLFLTDEWGADTSFVWFLWNVLALSVIMTWLFLRPGRSVIPAMLFHGGTNVIGSYFPLETDVVSGAPDFFVLRGIVYWAIAIALLIGTQGRLGLEREGFADHGPGWIWGRAERSTRRR
jgi:membrane protease YdiL (CAAX protease family)